MTPTTQNLEGDSGGFIEKRGGGGGGDTLFRQAQEPPGLCKTRFPSKDARTKEPLAAKILIANDNRINRAILSKYLGQLGHSFDTVTNGKEALEAYQNSPESYQCILMKPSMPVIGGMESTRLIREFECQKNLEPCLIVWTVASMLSLRQDLMDEYAVSTAMQMPVKLKNLVRVLDEVGIQAALPEHPST